MKQRITQQIYLKTKEEYTMFTEKTNTRYKAFSRKDFPLFAHYWNHGAWTTSVNSFEVYYPNLKKVSLKLFLSPLYQTLNGN
jgi:hypothetical protein